MTEMSVDQAGTQESHRAEHAIERAEKASRRALDRARDVAERIPAAAVIVVGGGALLALDAFGVGEVLTASVAAYAAYRLLRRSARERAAEAASGERETIGGMQAEAAR